MQKHGNKTYNWGGGKGINYNGTMIVQGSHDVCAFVPLCMMHFYSYLKFKLFHTFSFPPQPHISHHDMHCHDLDFSSVIAPCKGKRQIPSLSLSS